MITRTLAIAWLTLQEAVRSKLLLSLAILLVAGLVGLPLLIAGDNTLAGQIQVILTYTLAFATGMLSITTLWTACGGLSMEIQDRRLYLVITKPLHRHELWLGKWVGMMAMNAGLLLLTGLIISTTIRYTIAHSQESPQVKRGVTQQFLMARQALTPLTPDGSAAAAEAARQLIHSGQAPAGMPRGALEQRLMEEIAIRRFIVPPGGGIQFSFALPDLQDRTQDLILSYRFDSTRPERKPVAARWTVGSAPENRSSFTVTNYPGLPATLVLENKEAWGSHDVSVTYQRLDTGNQATLILADRTQRPELLVPCGSFEMNLLRGLLVILCRLAFLAALGLAAGCLLSTPVAVFAAFFILILMASAGYIETVATSGVFYVPHEGPVDVPTGLDKAILHLFRGFNAVTHPLTRLDPVPLLAAGRVVSGELTLLALGWLAGLYTAITALIGIALFNRRELG
jgi:hypothetical protein